MMQRGRLERLFYRLLWHGRGPLFAVLLLITAVLLAPALKVGIEQDNESMRGEDPVSQRDYRTLRELFGSDDLLLLGLRHPQLLTPQGLDLLQRLTRQIEGMAGVERVLSLTNARIAVTGALGAEPAPLLPDWRDNPGFAAGRDEQLQSHADQVTRLLSPDRQTAALLVIPKTQPGEQLARLITDLRQLADTLPAEAALRVTGVPVQKVDVARAIQHDQRVLTPLAVVVLAAVLALIFRRPAGVLLPLAVMAISLTWTIGLYALAGFPLNTITALLPPVVMVLAVAGSVHIYHGWLELAGERGDPRSLLAHRMAELFSPCLFTALTTMIGMFSLMACDIPAVQRFGLFSGIGVMLAFAVAITLMPAALTYLPLPGQRQRRRNRLLPRVIRQAMRLVFWRPGLVFGSALVLCCLALPVLDRIRNNTDLVRFFREDTPIYRDTMALDREIGGVVPLEFMIARHDGGPLLTADTIKRLADWRAQLRSYPEVTGTLSLLDLLVPINRAEQGDPGAPLPGDDASLLALVDLLLALPEQDLVGRLISADLRHLRFSVQLHALGSAATSQLSERLRHEANRILGDEITVTATGSYLEISNDSNRLVNNLLRSFIPSLVTIMITLYLFFRSGWLLLAALVPNLVPMAWTAGLMGWAGIDLSIGTAMVATVVIGLVVDNTTHFLHRYHLERHGHTRPALLRAALGVGPAMIISTVVLTLGFWVGVFSSFLPSVFFSLMTGVTLLGALLCDLLVLPSWMLLLDRLRPVRPVLILAPLLAATALLPTAAGAELAPPVPLASERQDLPARWAAIPKNPPHVGSVRLVKRSTAVVVQTDLETTVLRRVLAAIKEREQGRWKPGSPERTDMERYLAMLDEAVALVERRVTARPPDQDRYRRLQIEFIADPPRHCIVLLTREPNGPWEAFTPLNVSSRYLYGDMLAIVLENLAGSPADALAAVRPLLPPGTPLPEPGK